MINRINWLQTFAILSVCSFAIVPCNSGSESIEDFFEFDSKSLHILVFNIFSLFTKQSSKLLSESVLLIFFDLAMLFCSRRMTNLSLKPYLLCLKTREVAQRRQYKGLDFQRMLAGSCQKPHSIDQTLSSLPCSPDDSKLI